MLNHTVCRFFCAGLLAFSLLANAQTYPDRPVTIIAPFAAGGDADIAARNLAAVAQRLLGQNVIVVNRAGASGAIVRWRYETPSQTVTTSYWHGWVPRPCCLPCRKIWNTNGIPFPSLACWNSTRWCARFDLIPLLKTCPIWRRRCAVGQAS